MLTLTLASLLLSSNVTLPEVFKAFQVTDLAHPVIQTEIIDATCAPYYYLEMRFPFDYEGKPATFELDMQAITPETMNRLASAIREGYPKYGFPDCMKSDSYEIDDWTYDELKNVMMVHVSFKDNHGTCYGDNLPYTKCVDVTNLYPTN